MTIKFYNDTIDFLDEEILEDNVFYFEENVVKTKKVDEDTSPVDEDNRLVDQDTSPIIDDLIIKDDQIEFLDEITEDTKKFIKEITITKTIPNNFIQYTDDQFKNNILLLCKDLSSKDKRIKNVNNLLKIYKFITQNKIIKYPDKNLYPIIDIKKKFFLEETDNIISNNNELIIKDSILSYFDKKNKIINSTSSDDIREKQLYDLEKPFISLNDTETNKIKYTPLFDRDALTKCIYNNIENDNFDNFDNFECVNIYNKPIYLSDFRLLTNRNIKLNKDVVKPLYNGDNVRLVGYITKIPMEYNKIRTFNISRYFEDIKDMKENDKINIYLNVKTNIKDNKYSGKINSINENIIEIILNKEIDFLNKKTKKLIYNLENDYNHFYIYPQYEETNIYYKNPLNEEIIAFIFPEDAIKDDNNKYLAFILPNIKELISYYDHFINYIDVSILLSSHNFDINSLHNDDIQDIYDIINKNIEKNSSKNINLKKIDNKKYNFKTDNILFNIDKLPEAYLDYLEKNTSIDSNENRLIFLEKQPDYGFSHFIGILKNEIDTDYNNLKSLDYDKDLENFKKEHKKLESEQTKFKDDCSQIKIHKLYYNEQYFKDDEGNKKLYEGKYVLLNDENNVYSILYLMKNGSWEKQFILNNAEKNTIKVCDGTYYFEKIQNNICVYDNIDDLCKKKNELVVKRKIEILEHQIEITENIKDFIENFDEYKKELNNTQEYYKKFINNEVEINQINYNTPIKNKNYVGDENYINFDEVYNNFEIPNDPFYQPLIDNQQPLSDTELKKKDEQYYKKVEKILNSIGFGLSHEDINHITKAIDYFVIILHENNINDYKKKNKEQTLTNNEIMRKIYKDDIEREEAINRDILIIIASMIVIIIQIQYPNVKLIKKHNKCSKHYSLRGFPIETSENKLSQLYVYV